ncbi:ankyrin repeat-containing protein NPR4 [Senna tora]|uniref:Ankyrin repeat-containing protein NPR4 n=1 Tax=Senna tora TaxID=362788 RepID=A0A834T1C1_9FABA|nr:ankyrin repeat-containing protein NPR4 [Senna tora]
MPWEIHGSAMQMQWEVKWFQYVKENMPPYLNSQRNKAGHTPEEIFAEHHKDLVKQGNKWLKDTSSSYSIVAALTAGVTYSTSYTVPGGNDQDDGKPIFQGQPAFTLFAISALISFCLSVSSLAAFLAIYSSRMQPRDFQRSLPLKLLFGLTSFFICVITMLVSFCAAHSFELGSYNNGSEHKVIAWYGITLLPLCFYSAAQVPLYWDLLRASLTTVPKPNQVGEDVPI